MQEPKGPGWLVMTPPGGFLQGVAWGLPVSQGSMKGSSVTSAMPHTSLFHALPPLASLRHVLACAGPHYSHFTDKKTKTLEGSWEAL